MAATPGKQLRKMRAAMLKQQDRVKLFELAQLLKSARERRKAQLRTTVESCRRWRKEASQRVKQHRSDELARLRKEAQEQRQQARNRCQLRKHKIRASSQRQIDKRRAVLTEERKLQAQMKRLDQHAKARLRRHAPSAKERRQEGDEHVRNNLPAELKPVWDRVKKTIKGGPRRTRTEAFLEWAQENPDDVLQHQQHVTDREVAELVREHEQVHARLRKGPRHYHQLAKESVPF
jgi:hypothetical protein